MRVVIMNEGENPIRVIVDGDNVDDSTLQPGEEAALESREDGVIELRELGGPQADLSGEAAT